MAMPASGGYKSIQGWAVAARDANRNDHCRDQEMTPEVRLFSKQTNHKEQDKQEWSNSKASMSASSVVRHGLISSVAAS